MKKIFSLILLFFFIQQGFSQKTFAVSGSIKDAQNGEELVAASVYVKELKTGVTTNTSGTYTITLKPGKYTLQFSYIGYDKQEKVITIDQANLSLHIKLNPSVELLKEVEIRDQRGNRSVTKNEIGAVSLDVKSIKQIPVLMGEVDIIKVIQLLPGVMPTSEGGSGFSVRGGAPDQNLIMVDDATVYNASHALGFFSVFNNDAVQDVTLYKGDMPMQYGGRLSAVLDVDMREGDKQKYHVAGGIGLLASRLAVEGPIWKNKTSFLLAGRRTYFDLFLPLAPNEMAQNVKLYFWDLNAKLAHEFNKRNRLSLSLYGGLDVFGIKPPTYAQFDYGNKAGNLTWTHVFTDKFFMNVTALATRYDYSAGMDLGDMNALMSAFLEDYTGKVDFTWVLNPKNTIRFGVSSTYHTYGPGNATMTMEDNEDFMGGAGLSQKLSLPHDHALENAVYLGNDQKVTNKISLKYGIRFSTFSNIGEDSVYFYDKHWELIDTKYYKKGEIFNTYETFEPRIGAVYLLDSSSSIKANYSRTTQYTQLAQTSTGGNPMDMWFPANPNIKPQTADQFALGYFRNFQDNMWETSIEAYYKKMHHCIDLKDFASTMMNSQLYGELRVGEAQAYGIEFFVKKTSGKLNGWISYTLAKTERTIPEINEGRSYLAPYDKTHNLNIVLNYNINKRNIVSANWVYYTGNAVTFPTGRAEVGGIILPVYSDRNACRMPDYHRLDLSYTIKSKDKPERRWSYDWNFSIYNAYARHNPWSITFKQDPENPSQTYAEMIYLFSIVPAVTFNFKF